MKLMAVIIPMYNEASNAENCIRTVTKEILNLNKGILLYVVNDGSTDITAKIILNLLKENLPFKFIDSKVNSGYGAALQTGAIAAFKDGYEFGLFMDSDLTNDPKFISYFYEKIKNNQYDLVKASRYVRGGGMDGVPLNRQIISYIGNKIASKLFNMGIKDCTNGFRAIRLKFAVSIVYNESGFSSILEELYQLKKLKVKVAEIPNILTNRQSGKTNFRYSLNTFYSYFKYALKAYFV